MEFCPFSKVQCSGSMWLFLAGGVGFETSGRLQGGPKVTSYRVYKATYKGYNPSESHVFSAIYRG